MGHQRRATRSGKSLVFNRKVGGVFVVLLVIFGLINAAVYIIYRNQAYPHTKIGKAQTGQINKLTLPEKVNLNIEGSQLTLSLAELGITSDTNQINQSLKSERSWLPVYDLLRTHNLPHFVKVDQAKFDAVYKDLDQKYALLPQDAHVELKDGRFSAVAEKNGWKLDKTKLQNALTSALQTGQAKLSVPVATIRPATKTSDLRSSLNSLQSQQKVTTRYKYQDKIQNVSPADRATWYELSGNIYNLSEGQVRAGIREAGKKLGIGVKNLDSATAATLQSLKNGKDLTFILEAKPLPRKTYTYCVAGRGVEDKYLADLRNKLSAVYADSRGWGLDGDIAFVETTAGCGFTVWLSAPAQMPTFGAICDTFWSCEAGSNVVINFDRWMSATTPWNNSGGNLEDYRALAINHETGHQLGYGHVGCPGAGQPAPVMMQQSIDLQGCVFNAWPLPTELAALRAQLGI